MGVGDHLQPGDAVSRLAENRAVARSWNAHRRAMRVSLAQWARIVRTHRHGDESTRHSLRTWAMLEARLGYEASEGAAA